MTQTSGHEEQFMSIALIESFLHTNISLRERKNVFQTRPTTLYQLLLQKWNGTNAQSLVNKLWSFLDMSGYHSNNMTR